MTAEDILRVNPRFLTRAKSFDGFFSFGPVIVTPDEITDLSALTVRIEVNGVPGPANQIRNMTYGPAELIAFHSHGMTWEPGDILSTGTPGAVRIAAGDDVACLIDGVGVLRNAVA
jgi:2-keto-4-pentenoate hydratase/2-oxohepta-3-ene-1,7-dioic acid hydratase in catechol pathway